MNRVSAVEIPLYRRARGYRIYGDEGRRFLDFYQDDGHAILGHRQPRVMLEMKNLLSRGQIASYPSRLHAQTIQAVKSLIPGLEEVRIYKSEERALSAAGCHLKREFGTADVCDPALPGARSRGLNLWRPFLEGETIDAPLIFPVLPLSVPPSPAVLAFFEKPSGEVPPSDTCSPVSLAGLKKSIFELIEYATSCDRSRWSWFDSISIWSRKGPYLTLNIQRAQFARLFNEMLENGILLSPRFPGPSIIPGEFSIGEIGHIKERFATV